MKTLLCATFLFLVIALSAQQSIFGEKQLLFETQADNWSELLIPEDFNGDGKVDFLGEIDYDLYLYFASESNEYTPELLSVQSGDYNSFIDIDQDGDKDMMMEEVYFFENDGDNNFVREELDVNTLWNEELVYFGDIDMDGYPDVVGRKNTLYGTSKIRIHHKNEVGSFLTVEIEMDLCELGMVRVTDFNKDGYPDIMLLRDFRDEDYNYTHYLMTLINNGDRSWTIKTFEFSNYISFNSLEVRDFDLDGDLDVVLLDNYDKPQIVENQNGVLAEPVRLSNNEYQHVKSYDLNGDGLFDLVGFDFDFFPNYLVYGYYELNQGDFSFDESVKIGEVSGFSSISASAGSNFYHLFDVDQDGLLDFIFNAPVDNAMFWFKNEAVIPDPTEITMQPESMESCMSDQVVLEVQATGSNLGYQWLKDDIELNDESSNVLIIDEFSMEEEGSYWCRVSGEGGTVVSEIAQLNLEMESPVFTSSFQVMYIVADENCSAILPDITIDVEATDNCAAPPSISQEPEQGAFLEVGPNGITLFATDEAGNSASMPVIVVVEDKTDPELDCAEDLEIKANQGEYFEVENELDPVWINDNCVVGLVSNNINGNETLAGELFLIGEHQITWTASDVFGNASQCELTLEVLDPTGTTDFDDELIRIHPNPVNDKVFIQLNGITGENTGGKLGLFSQSGNNLLEFSGRQSSWTIDLSNYESGSYFIKIFTKEKVHTAQLIKI